MAITAPKILPVAPTATKTTTAAKPTVNPLVAAQQAAEAQRAKAAADAAAAAKAQQAKVDNFIRQVSAAQTQAELNNQLAQAKAAGVTIPASAITAGTANVKTATDAAAAAKAQADAQAAAKAAADAKVAADAKAAAAARAVEDAKTAAAAIAAAKAKADADAAAKVAAAAKVRADAEAAAQAKAAAEAKVAADNAAKVAAQQQAQRDKIAADAAAADKAAADRAAVVAQQQQAQRDKIAADQAAADRAQQEQIAARDKAAADARTVAQAAAQQQAAQDKATQTAAAEKAAQEQAAAKAASDAAIAARVAASQQQSEQTKTDTAAAEAARVAANQKAQADLLAGGGSKLTSVSPEEIAAQNQQRSEQIKADYAATEAARLAANKQTQASLQAGGGNQLTSVSPDQIDAQNIANLAQRPEYKAVYDQLVASGQPFTSNDLIRAVNQQATTTSAAENAKTQADLLASGGNKLINADFFNAAGEYDPELFQKTQDFQNEFINLMNVDKLNPKSFKDIKARAAEAGVTLGDSLMNRADDLITMQFNRLAVQAKTTEQLDRVIGSARGAGYEINPGYLERAKILSGYQESDTSAATQKAAESMDQMDVFTSFLPEPYITNDAGQKIRNPEFWNLAVNGFTLTGPDGTEVRAIPDGPGTGEARFLISDDGAKTFKSLSGEGPVIPNSQIEQQITQNRAAEDASGKAARAATIAAGPIRHNDLGGDWRVNAGLFDNGKGGDIFSDFFNSDIGKLATVAAIGWALGPAIAGFLTEGATVSEAAAAAAGLAESGASAAEIAAALEAGGVPAAAAATAAETATGIASGAIDAGAIAAEHGVTAEMLTSAAGTADPLVALNSTAGWDAASAVAPTGAGTAGAVAPLTELNAAQTAEIMKGIDPNMISSLAPGSTGAAAGTEASLFGGQSINPITNAITNMGVTNPIAAGALTGAASTAGINLLTGKPITTQGLLMGALGGGVAGGIGSVLPAPGGMFDAALNGVATNVGATAVVSLVSGKPITADTLAMSAALGGAVGAGAYYLGSNTYQYDDGSTMTVDPSGRPISATDATNTAVPLGTANTQTGQVTPGATPNAPPPGSVAVQDSAGNTLYTDGQHYYNADGTVNAAATDTAGNIVADAGGGTQVAGAVDPFSLPKQPGQIWDEDLGQWRNPAPGEDTTPGQGGYYDQNGVFHIGATSDTGIGLGGEGTGTGSPVSPGGEGTGTTGTGTGAGGTGTGTGTGGEVSVGPVAPSVSANPPTSVYTDPTTGATTTTTPSSPTTNTVTTTAPDGRVVNEVTVPAVNPPDTPVTTPTTTPPTTTVTEPVVGPPGPVAPPTTVPTEPVIGPPGPTTPVVVPPVGPVGPTPPVVEPPVGPPGPTTPVVEPPVGPVGPTPPTTEPPVGPPQPPGPPSVEPPGPPGPVEPPVGPPQPPGPPGPPGPPTTEPPGPPGPPGPVEPTPPEPPAPPEPPEPPAPPEPPGPVEPPYVAPPIYVPPIDDPTKPKKPSYPPITPPVWGDFGTLVNPGLNPGYITNVPRAYAPSGVRSQFYWGQHPYQPGPAFNRSLYNQTPAAPATPWGLQQMYNPQTQTIENLLRGVQTASTQAPYNIPRAPKV